MLVLVLVCFALLATAPDTDTVAIQGSLGREAPKCQENCGVVDMQSARRAMFKPFFDDGVVSNCSPSCFLPHFLMSTGSHFWSLLDSFVQLGWNVYDPTAYILRSSVHYCCASY